MPAQAAVHTPLTGTHDQHASPDERARLTPDKGEGHVETSIAVAGRGGRAVARRGGGGPGLSDQADHHRSCRSRRADRPTRSHGSPPRACPSGSASRSSSRTRWRRRHHRLDARGTGRAGRLYAAGPSRRACRPPRRSIASCPIDTKTAFAPIGLLTDAPMTFIARPDFPPNTLKELVAYAKKHGPKIDLCQCRPRRRLASVRHAVPDGDHQAAHHRAVQGQRSDHERPDRQADRHDLRPGHQHDRPDHCASRSRPTPSPPRSG